MDFRKILKNYNENIFLARRNSGSNPRKNHLASAIRWPLRLNYHRRCVLVIRGENIGWQIFYTIYVNYSIILDGRRPDCSMVSPERHTFVHYLQNHRSGYLELLSWIGAQQSLISWIIIDRRTYVSKFKNKLDSTQIRTIIARIRTFVLDSRIFSSEFGSRCQPKQRTTIKKY